ncbi:MAG: hypothetical protein WBI63_02135 [Coriobacteriia bacterium]
MLAFLLGMTVIAGGCAYVVGYAFVAPRESFLRSKTGGVALGMAAVVALVLTPSFASLVSSGGFGAWPPQLSTEIYHTIWVVLMGIGLLAGMRVWRMRPGQGGLAFDESAVGRVQSCLPLADTLDAALDVLSREAPAPRDIPRLTDAIRGVGLRFWHQMPERDSEVYNLVRSHVAPALAADVTRLLLEGAGRQG